MFTTAILIKTIIGMILILPLAKAPSRPDPSPDSYHEPTKYTSVKSVESGDAEWKQEESTDLGTHAAVTVTFADGSTHTLHATFDIPTEAGVTYAITARVTYTCKPRTSQAFGDLAIPVLWRAHTEQGGLRSGTPSGAYHATEDGETGWYAVTFVGAFTADELASLKLSHGAGMNMDNEFEIRERIDLQVSEVSR